jgi:hypothetical protein
MTRVDDDFKSLGDDLVALAAETCSGQRITGTRTKLLAAIERSLADPERLLALVAPLSAPARAALEVLVEIGGFVPQQDMESELVARSEAAATIGWDELCGRRLVIRVSAGPHCPDQLGTYPAVADALRPLFDAWWRARQAPRDLAQPGQTGGLSFRVYVLLAHLCNARPKMTQQWAIYASERNKLAELFPSTTPEAVDTALAELGALEIVRRTRDGRLQVDPARVDALLATEPSQIWAITAGLKHCSFAEKAALSFLARRPGWLDAQEVRRATRLAVLRYESQGHYGVRSVRESATRATLLALDALGSRGWAETNSGGDKMRISGHVLAAITQAGARSGARSAGPKATPAPAVCHVQPNFEIIVPPEADPKTIFEVGRLGRLRSCDQVAIFGVTADSIATATRQGLSADDILTRLRAASTFPIPPNVEQGIRDFAKPPRSACVLTGLVVVMPDDDAGCLRGAGLRPTSLPRVFVGSVDDEDKLLRLLDKAGMTTTYWDGDDDEPVDARSSGENPLLEKTSALGWLSTEHERANTWAGIREPAARPPDASDGHSSGSPSLHVLGLPARIQKALLQAGIDNVLELVTRPETELRQVHRIGWLAARVIRAALAKHGLRLGMPFTDAARQLSAAPAGEVATNHPGPAPASNGAIVVVDLDDLPNSVGGSNEKLRLLLVSLPHAPGRWRRDLACALSVGCGQLVAEDKLESLLRTHSGARAAAIDVVEKGYEDLRPPFGETAARAAIEQARDLLLWPAGAREPIRLTPHRILKRGKDQVVMGHVAGTEEDRSFPLQPWIALGPRSTPADRQRAYEAQSPRVTTPQGASTGRNRPCPCGSGVKYKKCCLARDEQTAST